MTSTLVFIIADPMSPMKLAAIPVKAKVDMAPAVMGRDKTA